MPRDCDVSEGRGRLTEKVCCNAGNGPVTVSMTRSFLLYNFTSIHCNQTQTCTNNFTSVDFYSMLKECERLAFPAGTLLPSSLHLPACPPCCPPVSAMPQAKGPWPCRVHPHAHSSQLGWAGQGRGTDKLEIQGILLSTIFWYHSSTISVTSKLSPRLELPFFIFFFNSMFSQVFVSSFVSVVFGVETGLRLCRPSLRGGWGCASVPWRRSVTSVRFRRAGVPGEGEQRLNLLVLRRIGDGLVEIV